MLLILIVNNKTMFIFISLLCLLIKHSYYSFFFGEKSDYFLRIQTEFGLKQSGTGGALYDGHIELIRNIYGDLQNLCIM